MLVHLPGGKEGIYIFGNWIILPKYLKKREPLVIVWRDHNDKTRRRLRTYGPSLTTLVIGGTSRIYSSSKGEIMRKQVVFAYLTRLSYAV
jgi:hypothetical protein